MWIACLIASVLISIAIQSFLESISKHSPLIKLYGIKLYGQTIVKHFWLFYVGMFIARFRSYVLPITRHYWWIFLLLSAFFYHFAYLDIDLHYKLFQSLFLVLGLLGFAYRFPKLAVPLDISYGVYLYHIIVLNVFIHLGAKSTWLNFTEVFLLTIVIAIISTVTIGNFSAKQKTEKIQRLEASQ